MLERGPVKVILNWVPFPALSAGKGTQWGSGPDAFLRHGQHRLDHVAVVRGLKGLVDLIEGELLNETVVGEPALGVQRDQRADQRYRAALAAEDTDDLLAPQGGDVG